MPSWLDDYMDALDNRDRREKAYAPVIEAYAKLADEMAALAAAKREAEASAAGAAGEQVSPPPPPVTGLQARFLGSPRASPGPGSNQQPQQDATGLASLRADLTTAHRSQAALEQQVSAMMAQLASAQASAKTQQEQTARLQQRANVLEQEKTLLMRKLRDRDSELKEKARLVENVQDEMLGLEMQTNMAEQKAAELKAENSELVERWMKRMGKEADRMNEGSGWK